MRLGKGFMGSAPFLPAERFMLATALALAVVNLVAITWRGMPVEWPPYAAVASFSVFVIFVGLFYRVSGRSDRLANSLISTGSFILFAMMSSAFTYQLLPVWRAPIDPWLMKFDAMLGFHWPDFLAFAARHPWLSETTRYAYMSSLFQFLVLVLALGFSGRTHELHTFMLATVISCLTTIAIWALFPSFGTTTVFAIDPAVEAQLRPLVGSSYGAELQRIAVDGHVVISPRNSLGLVAAPSYHTVMALLAIYAARTVPWLWPGALAINVMVLPGVLIHGGHHLVDIFAGAVVTAFAIIAAQAFLLQARTAHTPAVPTAS